MADDEVRGSDPTMTTKDMLREVYDWAIAEKAAGLPKRMTAVEVWQNRVVGGVTVLLGLNLMDRIAVYLTPKVAEAASTLVAMIGGGR